MLIGSDDMIPINRFSNSYIQTNNQTSQQQKIPNQAINTSNVHNQSGEQNALGKVSRDFIVPKDQRIEMLKESFDDKTLKRMGVVECQTCANRVYQDSSNDPGVSFKSPTHLNPSQAASAVASHEQEHVSNEQADAKANDREIVSQSVQIFTSVCPECGKAYVSGGLTKTTTRGAQKDQATQAYQNSILGNKSSSTEGNLLDFSL